MAIKELLEQLEKENEKIDKEKLQRQIEKK